MESFLLLNWDKLLGFILAFFTILSPLYQFFKSKSLDQRNKRFQNYHNLLEDLLNKKEPSLDRQMAIIFELRNFKEYYPVTLRILKGVKEGWQGGETAKKFPRVIAEIELTESYIKNRPKRWGRLLYHKSLFAFPATL